MDVKERAVQIHHDSDVVTARSEGRALAARIGFSGSEQVLIATAISEAARNILQYAGTGTIILSSVDEGNKRGILIVARDEGPGIADVERAMIDGYSTSGGLGLGLPGIKRLMSDLEVISAIGKGTTLIMRRWRL